MSSYYQSTLFPVFPFKCRRYYLLKGGQLLFLLQYRRQTLTSQTKDTSLYIKDQLISTATVVTMLRLKFCFVPSDSPPLAASTSWARCCYYCCAYTTNEKGYIKTRHDVRTKPGDLVGNLLQSNTTSYSNTEDFDCYLL